MPLVPSLPRSAWQLLAGNGLSAFGSGLVLPFTLLYLAEVRGLGLATAGLAMGTVPVAALLTNLIAGPAVDRFGARRVLMVTLAVGALGTASFALVRSPWQAFVAAALFGVGVTSSWVGLQPLLSTIVPAASRADAFAVQFALLNAGFGGGALVGGLLVDFGRPHTLELVYTLDAASFLAQAVIVFALRGGAAPPRVRPEGGYREVFRDGAFRRVWSLNALLVSIGTVQIETGFPAYAVLEGGASTRTLGFAFAANTFAIVGGQFLVLRWIRGRRRTRGIALQTVFWAAAWGVALAAGELRLGALSAAGFVLVGVLFACGEMLHSPSVPTIVNDLAPDRLRGRYNAANAVSWQTGRIVGAPVSTQLIAAGLAVPLLGGLIALCGLAAGMALGLERRLDPQANGVSQEPVTGTTAPGRVNECRGAPKTSTVS